MYPDHFLPEDTAASQRKTNATDARDGAKKQGKPARTEKQRTPISPQAAVMQKVRTLLASGKAEEAFDLLNARGFHDPDSRNARAVCLMQMGQPELAVRALREICLTGMGAVLKSDVPTHFATNLAAALFASGNVSGCTAVLDELSRDHAPSVMRLRKVVREWESKLSFWQRLKWRCGLQTGMPTSDFDIPMEIDPPEDESVLEG